MLTGNKVIKIYRITSKKMEEITLNDSNIPVNQ